MCKLVVIRMVQLPGVGERDHLQTAWGPFILPQ
jgi:hypothetical protein